MKYFYKGTEVKLGEALNIQEHSESGSHFLYINKLDEETAEQLVEEKVLTAEGEDVDKENEAIAKAWNDMERDFPKLYTSLIALYSIDYQTCLGYFFREMSKQQAEKLSAVPRFAYIINMVTGAIEYRPLPKQYSHVAWFSSKEQAEFAIKMVQKIFDSVYGEKQEDC